jgi:hypothetical protein
VHIIVLCAFAATLFRNVAFGQANAAGYTWSNVYTGGGGGYIPNIIFNPSQKNLIYARTDIGGAYKWNPTTSLWVPLMDWVTWANWNELGVESLATDPVNPNNLYIMAGLYTNSFTTQNGTLLISNNQGSTFTQVPMPFKVGGNMPARNMGERLAIDPNLNSILFFAARSGNGLWESTNSGTTWSQVTSFPQPGTYAVEPGNVYSGDIIGPAWVVFDPRTGSAGKATQTIYVGVAQPDGTNIYVTKNGGATWAPLAGQPTCTLTGTQTTGTVACTNGASWAVASDAPGPGFFPNRAVLAPTTGMLYITYSNGAGPYDGTMGDVQQYNTSTGVWTEIAPVVPTTLSGADYFGYSGLAVDPQVPTTIMVSAFNSWWPDTILWRSTNSGATWSQIWNWTSYPSRSFMYTLSDTAAPWVNEGNTNPVAPIEAPELGWMVSGLAIDPFNSNHMLYGTGMTMWGTENLTQWDSGNQFALSIASQGIEETSVIDLISPPAGGGAHLYSALGDIGGFIHTSMTTAPAFPYAIPFFGTRTSIDYAELSPQFMVVVGDGSPTASPVITSSAFTYSGGTSETAWFAGTVDPPGYSTNGGGTVAAAADASRVVWNPTGMGAFYSTANGSSWTASTGLPTGGIIASDRVNPLQFYDYAAGQFYVSTNGGVSFTATAATGLPASGDSVNFKAVPGHEGDIWLAGGSTNAGDVYGLWHSTNSGASFTQLTNVTQADIVGFGMAAPGATYPTLFTNAEIGGVRGIFASTNEGVTWTQINDSAHEYGLTGATITGDPQVFGTVYLGTNGRGIITGTGTPPYSSSGGSFTLKPSASALSIAQGSSGTDTITVTDVSPFTGSVSFAASGLPSGVTASFSPASSTTSSVLTLTASSTATAGTSTVTITGTSGTLTPVTTTFTLTVTPVTGTFTLKPSATALSIAQGSSGTDTITVTDVSPFTGSVAFAASGLPSGVTASFSPASSATSSVLTLTASSTATAGTSTVTITGTSGTLTPVTTTFTLTVTPVTGTFTLKPSATALSIAQGSSGTDTITVTDVSPFTGSVSFAASGLPSGVTASFSPASFTTSSVLTLTASSTATAGTSTVTITGTSGTLTPVTTTFTLTVTPVTGTFTLKPSATALSIAQGSSGTDTITVTDVSPFTGSVAFAATGQPTGVTAAFSPTSSTTSSVVTFTVASSTVAGTYPITIIGTSGTLTPVTTTITLTVTGTSPKCTVDYTISSQWQGGFGAAITIVNNGTTALSNWTLTWSFANGQTITQLWNGTETQSGTNVTVTNLSYNGSIPAGGSYAGMGFNGTWNNTTNAVPTAISLNGTACTVN